MNYDKGVCDSQMTNPIYETDLWMISVNLPLGHLQILKFDLIFETSMNILPVKPQKERERDHKNTYYMMI